MGFVESWLLNVEAGHLYLLVFLLMVSNGFLSTPPSEVTWGVAGFAASLGKASAVALFTAGVSGNVVGTTLLFWLAYRWGEGAVRRLLRFNPMLGDSLLAATHHAFDRHGSSIVLVGRCLPVVRSIVSVPAGVSKMSLRPFLLLTTAGCSLWALLWGGAGLFVGHQIQALIADTKLYGLAVTGLVLLFVALWLKRQMKIYLEAGEGGAERTRNGAHLDP